MSRTFPGRSGQGHWARMVGLVGVGVAGIAGPALISPTAAVPTAAATPRCGGEPATIVGTAGEDTLRGTPGRDVVVARGGHDFVYTGAGPDLVCAGGGWDFVRLGPGRDQARGAGGQDELVGNGGADRLFGAAQVDGLQGGPGDDLLRGGAGRSLNVEMLLGGPGDDRLAGGPGLDNAGFFESPHGVRVDLARGSARGDGNDALVGIEGVVGSQHDDVLVGDRGGNGMYGLAGDDTIRAKGSGRIAAGTADFISGGDGDDTLAGGTGQDLVTYSGIPFPVTVDLARHRSTGQGRDTLRGIEGVEGGIADDRLLGSRGADLLAGSLGNDELDGRVGRDTALYNDIRGPVDVVLDPVDGSGLGEAAGSDVLRGIENVWGTNQADQLSGDDGANQIRGLDGDDVLIGFEGVDRLDGGRGNDVCTDVPEQSTACEAARHAAHHNFDATNNRVRLGRDLMAGWTVHPATTIHRRNR